MRKMLGTVALAALATVLPARAATGEQDEGCAREGLKVIQFELDSAGI